MGNGGENYIELNFSQLEHYGCTDPDASNYNPDATVDDVHVNIVYQVMSTVMIQ